jgi:hypothetical protein
MGKTTVSGMLLTLLLSIGVFALTLSVKPIKATTVTVPEVILSDKEIIPNPGYTSSIAFTAATETSTTTNIWFQIKASFDEIGLRFSACMENVEIIDSRRLTITFVDPYDPRFDRLPSLVGDTIYMTDPYWHYDWPVNWVYGITSVHDNWEFALTGYLSEICVQACIPISLDIFPSTLNLKSKGRWISGHIELVGGHNVGDIDVSTILLNDEVPAESGKVGGKKLSVKFDRSRAIASLPQVGEVELTVTGKLFNGTPFEGSDSIRVK